MKSIIRLFLTIILISCTAYSGSITFLESPGVFPIPGSKEVIEITKQNDKIQFRIRGSGPSEPIIIPTSGWFVAVIDKDHAWVHLGGGRLFYYSWLNESGSHSRVDEWQYPKMGAVLLPSEIEQRIRN